MITMLLVWGLVGLLLGIIYVTVIPWVSARLIGADAIERVSSWYVWLAQTSIGKSALIIRPGSVDLVSKKYDPDQKADKDTAGGEPRHHHDSFGGLRSIANKPFGIGLHDVNEYVTPLLSEIGEKAKELHEREELGSEVDSDDLEMQDGIPIPGTSTISDLRKARHLPTGDADPEDGHRSYKKTVISQEKFHEKMTFGQTIILVGSLLASMGLAWLLASQGGSAPDVSGGTTVSMLLLFAAPASGWLGAIGLSALLVLAVPIVALISHGIIAAAIVIVMSIATAAGYVVGIALFGPSLPGAIGQPLAAINWTLAQLCVGRGVLVERDTGQYEHHQLVKNEDGDTDWICKLDNGNWLGVNGSVGDMVRFAWAPLAITAEKSDENMTAISSEVSPNLATDGGEIRPEKTRRGFNTVFDVEKANADWTVTLPQLWKWCEGSAESEAVREGRDTALTKRGGRQQMSYIIYIALIVMSMIAGGLIGLIAGGAIP